MNGVVEKNVRGLAAPGTELGRLISDVADRCFGPIRVQVSGRTGVGKSSVRAVLDAHHDLRMDGAGHGDVLVTEAASIDVPRSPDPVLDGDVVIHVLASGAQPADIAAVASARAGAAEVVAVLAKADTIDHLDAVVEQLSSSVGVPVHPLMGTVAVSVMRGLPTTFDGLRSAVGSVTSDMLLSPERFLRAALSMPRQERLTLVEQIEMRGVGTIVEALAVDPATDDATLRLLLAERSGSDSFVRAVRKAVDNVRVDRQGRALHRLTELAAANPETEDLERYLGSDEAVIAIMRSALRALGEPEEQHPTLRTVAQWQERRRASVQPAQARAALAVARGYMRVRTR